MAKRQHVYERRVYQSTGSGYGNCKESHVKFLRMRNFISVLDFGPLALEVLSNMDHLFVSGLTTLMWHCAAMIHGNLGIKRPKLLLTWGSETNMGAVFGASLLSKEDH